MQSVWVGPGCWPPAVRSSACRCRQSSGASVLSAACSGAAGLELLLRLETTVVQLDLTSTIPNITDFKRAHTAT